MQGNFTQELHESSDDLQFSRQGVPWDDYERILAENARNDGSLRVTYDRGTLEIARFSARQEETNRVLTRTVMMAAAALHVAIRDLGAATCRRRDLHCGFDPGASFSLRHAPRHPAQRELGPPDDPPDLIIDIAASDALDRRPLFAAFGVPEVWRYDVTNDRVVILRLIHGRPRERRESAALVPVTSDLLTRLVHDSRSQPFDVWTSALESWLRTYD